MARGPQLPKWWVVSEVFETFQEMRNQHRSGGRLPTAEEDAIESDFILTALLPVVIDSADCQSIAQAIARYGPESDHARRMLASRARRRAELARITNGATAPSGRVADLALTARY